MFGYYVCWLCNMLKNINCFVFSYFCFMKIILYFVNFFLIGMGYVFINLFKKNNEKNVGIELIEF